MTSPLAPSSSSSSLSMGSPSCPCIDATSYASRITNCNYNNTDEPGFWQYPQGLGAGACYPLSFGSSFCLPHDVEADPLCSSASPPSYCGQKWCYVDPNKCKDSEELYFVSAVPAFAEQNVFYSYSTCNSTNDDWDRFTTVNAIGGETLRVTLPAIWNPGHYKASDIDDDGNQHYYDDNVPWRGWVIDYLEAILKISNIGGLNYTYRSVGSQSISSSKYTASIGDVRAGITDIVASSLWITSERLSMTSFTTQTATDKIFLWVPAPTITEAGYAKKVLEPFDPLLWVCLMVAIFTVSALSLLFATPLSSKRTWWKQLRSEKWEESSPGRRVLLGLRIFSDAFIAYATFFFGHTVDYDIRASYPAKILNFGYGFLILIAVAAYTANLAAFLTLAGVSKYIESMEEAIESRIVICGPQALQKDLQQVWPAAIIEYYDSPDQDMFELFDAGRCGAIIGSEWDFRQSSVVVNGFCDREIIRSKSLALEIPLGFAASPKYVAGLSYWMEQAEKNGTTFASFEAATRPPLSCSLDVPNVEVDELVSLTPANFALPFFVYLACAIVAVVLYIFQARRERLREEAEFLAGGELVLSEEEYAPKNDAAGMDTRTSGTLGRWQAEKYPSTLSVGSEVSRRESEGVNMAGSITPWNRSSAVMKDDIGSDLALGTIEESKKAPTHQPSGSPLSPTPPSPLKGAKRKVRRESTAGRRMSFIDLAEDNDRVETMLDMMREMQTNQDRLYALVDRMQHEKKEK